MRFTIATITSYGSGDNASVETTVVGASLGEKPIWYETFEAANNRAHSLMYGRSGREKPSEFQAAVAVSETLARAIGIPPDDLGDQ